MTTTTKHATDTMKSRMAPIKTRSGRITGYIELFWVSSAGVWVSIPGVSKFQAGR